ncbi:efflux RND transporter periplasmic adaptor subunit [Paraflavitalea sp. CAU 1676]|uniref:efflux RND transporter periplasmic adaptor subunit n=1 Tax=Paraflavitalea sp. CAU 1676 TaxID=3032598 RepID=UPI0023DC808E|nr:efflux RND transporter periplasmic adaptor subunit [Paraflavitalea sp. CAU 1676]MDF2190740.1 efflux RND transporter periplasmic adaptor subunit [Paraflavitalea sp. CAU 1676]
MKTMYKLFTLALVVLLAACGATSGDKELVKKKAELEKLKGEQKDLAKQIDSLEAQIKRIDPTTVKEEKTKLVAVAVITPAQFTHYIDLKGKIDAQNIGLVTPRGPGGLVKAIFVKQGDPVRKGQLLMKLDDPMTQQQIEQARINLNLAQTTYDRRKNLWDQKIGTEIELLNAKANVENIQKQIDLLKEQADLANVYAEMSGVADEVTIKVGETFSAATASMRGITIVNSSELKVVADVPEAYQGRVNTGSNLLITLPELNNDTIRTRVNVAGRMINPDTRSFQIEAKISANSKLRPNQLAMVRIQDYQAPRAITVPISTLQSDEKGKFVLVAVKEGTKLVARKKNVTVGELYGDRLEIKSGLQAGEQLITEGFQGLYDGQLITTDVK